MARAVLTAREWVNIPPNLLYPDSFAEEVRGLVKDARITIDVMDENRWSGRATVGSWPLAPGHLVRRGSSG